MDFKLERDRALVSSPVLRLRTPTREIFFWRSGWRLRWTRVRREW